jgi:glycosyltransferase involved in cell wall biosynthesis
MPAYNEGDAIREVVAELRAMYPDFEIIVVDDGSKDNTAEVAEQAGARVIRHTYNVGNGAAVKTGIRNATGDIVVMLDADGQHPPSEIARLLEHIGPYDMAVGARSSMAKVSKFRSFGNWGLIRIAEFLTETSIPDLTSGFRAIKRDKVLEFLHLFPNQYSYPTTITMSMLKSGYFVKFVMMDSIKRRETGTSHIRPLRDGLRFINIMIRIIMLFDPNKVFLPLGFFFFFLGVVITVVQIATKFTVTGSAVMMFLAGLFIMLFGLVADQVAAMRREMSRLGRIDI